MRVIEIDDRTFDKLEFSARLMQRTIGEVVRLLVERPEVMQPSTQTVQAPDHRLGPSDNTSSPTGDDSLIAVSKTFKGHRVVGRFNPSTAEVIIDSAPWNGRAFASPTASAQAVVEAYSEDRMTPNTNGRKFWKVTETGRDLRSIMGERF